MLASIVDLPNEVIQQALRRLAPVDVLQFQQVCRRFYELADTSVWRHLCRTHFKYWKSERNPLKQGLKDPTASDWKQICLERQRTEFRTTELLESVLATQVGRIDKFQRIIELGYDAKDSLLKHFTVEDDAEDVLARRYYSTAVLGCLHRVLAIKEWTRSQGTDELSLERALAAFDLFVLHDRDGDFEETGLQLDKIAEAIRDNLPGFKDMTARQKALEIAKHLREKNLTGISHDEDKHYHDLQNNFIGIALQDPSHPSLPLTSTAIFCCVADRLGLEARACGFPFHVVAIVKPSEGMDLDSNPLPVGQDADPMYLDPFRSDNEIPVAHLISRLRLVGASESSHTVLLEPSSVPEIVLRTARNIMASVQESHRQAMARRLGHEHVLLVSSFPDLEGAFYGALWASLLLGTSQDADGPAFASTRRRNYLPPFVEHFETHFPIDANLIEDEVMPLFHGLAEYAQLRDSVRVMRSVDSMPKQVKRRSKEISQRVQYRIGQVFVHRRYNYLAVITGWDVECGADEHWMAQMRIHELARGKHQSFYHVLVEDKSVRYVAEENIAIVRPETPFGLMSLAGRHFKRWDRSTKCFVSNIRDEYPDN